MDITEWLRGLHERRRTAFGDEGVAGCRYAEAADQIEQLRMAAGNLIAALDDMHARGETFTAKVSLATAEMRTALTYS